MLMADDEHCRTIYILCNIFYSASAFGFHLNIFPGREYLCAAGTRRSFLRNFTMQKQ